MYFFWLILCAMSILRRVLRLPSPFVGSKQSWKQWEELTQIVALRSTQRKKIQRTINRQNTCFEQDSIESKPCNASQHECPNMACDASPQEGAGVIQSATLINESGDWPVVFRAKRCPRRFHSRQFCSEPDDAFLGQFGFLATRKRFAAFQQWPDWFRRHTV